MTMSEIDAINDAVAEPDERIAALEAWASSPARWAERRAESSESNNHIHTCYSFSPYTPAAAALGAWRAGLAAAGSVDHDSHAGAEEMRRACAVLGMGCVTGFEIRVFMHREAERADGPGAFFAHRKINNPDSEGIVYMTIQGVPQRAAASVAEFLKPIRERRRARTARMAERAREILSAAGVEPFDFERDVAGKSMFARGGTITERHLLAAMSNSLIEGFGRGESLARGVEARLGVKLKPKTRTAVADPKNPYLMYDLLGVLKAEFLPSFFIQPDDECVDASTAVAFARSIGAIPAYAYLGDVGESPTGDKKAEKYEDDFLPELFAELRRLGYLAVTYMPPRNTAAQLSRLQNLCSEFGFMEISGVDINQPRQAFGCPELRLPQFAHLNDSTWAMVAHEALSSFDPSLGLFSPSSPLSADSLSRRISRYAEAGLDLVRSQRAQVAIVAENLRKGRY